MVVQEPPLVTERGRKVNNNKPKNQGQSPRFVEACKNHINPLESGYKYFIVSFFG